MNNLTDDKRMLVYGPNSPHTDIFCFSTTRHGGCSEGNYASFNCNHYCGDVPDKVERNRGTAMLVVASASPDAGCSSSNARYSGESCG